MGIIKDFIGYSAARNLAKFILIITAIAISTFAMQGFLAEWLGIGFGLEVRNIVALSLIMIGLLIKDDVLTPRIPFLNDRELSKFAFYGILALIAIAISTLSFEFLDNLLNTTFLDFPSLAVRNIIGIMLLIWVRTIHNSG